MKILVIEDDERIRKLLERNLAEEGYQVSAARGGHDGLEMFRVGQFDLVVLDVMLPQLDGFALLKKARSERLQTPVIFLTARDDMADLVKGLDLGADDYLTKPFMLEELLARVRAISRRGSSSKPVVLTVGDLSLDRASRKAIRGGKSIPLTRKEFIVLELLMRRVNNAVSRDEIIEAGWGIDSEATANTVEALMSGLRGKIDGEHALKLMHTIRGFGYRVSEHEL